MRILTLLICAALFWWGGKNFLSARRDIMPCVLALACGLLLHSAWGCGALLAVPFLHFGYGEKSRFRHIFGDGWGRGVWGILVAVGLSAVLFFSGHIYWLLEVIYLVIGFTLENALKKLNQSVGDPLIGAGFALLIFFLH